ncbi:MAG: aldose 1-epimerase family protein [Streptococcaceae bacterium]|jgi:galactose mutarotase-like enzyme|nr:aldose 1-epimerase family protein [Streptococcaceae bacterium]
MDIQLKNGNVKAVIRSKGAELVSLQSNETGIEYIWSGDAEYWGRHTPVLFPHVGRLKGDVLSYKGKDYPSGQHGFARDKEFEIALQTETKAVFVLKEDAETLFRYPFSFVLTLSFELSENGIRTTWKVENPAEEILYFGIGGHPAFQIPLTSDLEFTDYSFDVRPQGVRKRLPFVPPFLDPLHAVEEEVGNIPFDHELFYNDALVYETVGETQVRIVSHKSPHSVTLSYTDIPYVGLWSPYPKESPFVCIEPWCSYADTPEDTGDFSTKTSVQSLQPKEKFETSYLIEIQ